MKTRSASLQLLVLVAAGVVLSGPAFRQSANAQPLAPGMINPATGVPVPAGNSTGISPATGLPAAGRPGGIDPTTGLPIPGRAGASAPAARLSPNPGSSATIDPFTGLPLPGPRSSSALPDITDTGPGSVPQQVRELIDRGRFEEALQSCLSYHIHTRLSVTNGVLVAVLPDWLELGQRYPKAKLALLDIRDSDARQFADGLGNVQLFKEIAEINAALGEKDYTYALFLGLEQGDPSLARECYLWMEPALVERGEYAVCARYLGSPQARFGAARQAFEATQSLAQHVATSGPATVPPQGGTRDLSSGLPRLTGNGNSDPLRMAACNAFVRSVNQLLEILVAGERQAEAEQLRTQALAVVDDPRLRPSVSDIEARVKAVQATLRSPPAPITIHPQFAEPANLFPPEHLDPSASVEHWAPVLKPETKLDAHAILAEARADTERGRYEESLQRHLWYHNHALEYDPEGQRGVRLSFALADWVALGRKYPTALQALVEVRDHDLQAFAENRGSYALFKDIAAINEQLGHELTTGRLFKWLATQQPALARRCYPLAETALVQQGDYALCLAYVGDGQARFQQHRQNWERLAKWEHHMGQVFQQAQLNQEAESAQSGRKLPMGVSTFAPPAAADRLLINDTRQLVEILVGAGHKADAENICTQALALVDDPRLQSAVSDAEKKLSR